jgi:excisionase family DNA binding protein
MSELLTCEEAAERLGIHTGTFRSWIRDGHIPAYRLGQRFTRVEWEEVLQALADQGKSRSLRVERRPEGAQ